MTQIELFINGTCLVNPGPGGWAYLLRKPGKERLRGGSASDTTNNRMELTATIRALKALGSPSVIHVITSSKYVVDGMTTWSKRWKARGWSLNKSGSKPVKNAELWKELDQLSQSHEITWEWVRGHAQYERLEAISRAEANKCSVK